VKAARQLAQLARAVFGLLLSHFAGYVLFRLDRSQMQTRDVVEEATFLGDLVQQPFTQPPDQLLPLRVRLVDPSSPVVPRERADLPAPLAHFLDDMRNRMPP